MKLISLTLTPEGDPNGDMVEVIFNPNPSIFTSGYVRVVRRIDGSTHLTDHPDKIRPTLLGAAYRNGIALIDRVCDMTYDY